MNYTKHYLNNIKRLKAEIEKADAVLIGAGAGFSTAAGLTYTGDRFYKYFSDFNRKYGITDIYSGGFYPYQTLEEYWAWWSRHIYYNRYDLKAGKPYTDLLELVKAKDYFVLTTNVDHQFQLAGFDKKRLFYTYDNEDAVRKMLAQQQDMKIPSELIPKCPVCGAPMTMNLRSDDLFVQDDGWYRAADRYEDFVRRHKNLKILFIELGVGANTPAIIKYPFWQMTARNPKTVYACINQGEAFCPKQIEHQSICIDADIAKVLDDIKEI